MAITADVYSHVVEELDRDAADKTADLLFALVMAAGDNPERLHSEGAWAHLCDVAPVPKGSGKTNGHFERRVKEGKTKPEIIRILKRYVAREVYRYLPRG